MLQDSIINYSKISPNPYFQFQLRLQQQPNACHQSHAVSLPCVGAWRQAPCHQAVLTILGNFPEFQHLQRLSDSSPLLSSAYLNYFAHDHGNNAIIIHIFLTISNNRFQCSHDQYTQLTKTPNFVNPNILIQLFSLNPHAPPRIVTTYHLSFYQFMITTASPLIQTPPTLRKTSKSSQYSSRRLAGQLPPPDYSQKTQKLGGLCRLAARDMSPGGSSTGTQNSIEIG